MPRCVSTRSLTCLVLKALATRPAAAGLSRFTHDEISEQGADPKRHFAAAKGNFVKYTKQPELIPKWKLLSGEQCEEHVEKTYGKNREVARGLPQLQIRLVYDEMRYPQHYLGSAREYYPQLFVDEFCESPRRV